MFWQRRKDRAARVGNYKWVESARGNGLFDLSKDIGERHDLSAEQPEVLARLREIGIDYAQGFLLHRPEPIGNLFGTAARLARV